MPPPCNKGILFPCSLYRDSTLIEKGKLDGSTHACNIDQCGGGVARNMAEALWRLRGGRTRLLTALGDDADGQYLDSIAPGLLLDGCIIKGGRTPSYAAVLDSRGECLLGLGDMALHNHITPDLVNKHMKVLEQAPLIVIDGNAPQATIDHVLAVCEQLQKPGKDFFIYFNNNVGIRWSSNPERQHETSLLHII